VYPRRDPADVQPDPDSGQSAHVNLSLRPHVPDAGFEGYGQAEAGQEQGSSLDQCIYQAVHPPESAVEQSAICLDRSHPGHGDQSGADDESQQNGQENQQNVGERAVRLLSFLKQLSRHCPA